MTTTSLSWYNKLLWRCLARTLGWTFWSCVLNRLRSMTLFCWVDKGGCVACAFAFSRIFRARSIALNRGFPASSVTGSCLASVVRLRFWNDCAHGIWRYFPGVVVREKTVDRLCLQSLTIHTVLLEAFIFIFDVMVYTCWHSFWEKACSPRNYIQGHNVQNKGTYQIVFLKWKNVLMTQTVFW